MAVDYLLAQDFLRIEAIGMSGARHSDPADPVWLRVYVTAADDIKDVYEDVTAGAATTGKLYRAKTGTWVFRLDPGRYTEGKTYTCHFRFQMSPGNDNVVRKNFTWEPIAETPNRDGTCVIYGRLTDIAGIPVTERKLVVEKYKDALTLTKRVGSFDLLTDAFGYWWTELERGGIYRLVFGDLSKTIRIPDDLRVALSDIPEFQLDAPNARLDSFGYPLPL